MKKLIAATGVILISCLCISTAFAPKATANESVESVAAETEPQTQPQSFLIKAENGKIVVYKSGISKPYLKTDTSVTALPKQDLIEIEKGIEVNSEKELKRVLEDYCS